MKLPCPFALGLVVFCQAISLYAQTWNLGTGGSWNTAGNWNPATIPNSVGASITINCAASGSNPAQTASRTITLDGAQTVGSITINNDAVNSFTNGIATGTSGSLTFDASGSGPATITVNGVSGATGNTRISGPMTLNDPLVAQVNNIFTTASAGALDLTATISGSGGFTKNGDGLCQFGTGAKTYSGPTVLNAGRMVISQLARPKSSSSITVNAGAQLTLFSAGTYDFGPGALILNGTGAANLPYSQFPGAMRNNRGINPITISNAIILQSDALIHVQANGGTGGSASPGNTNILANVVSGPGKLTLTAPNSDLDQGFLILNGANTYSGGTLVNGGFLVASGASATFGTGDVTVNNAASPNSIARLRIESGVVDAISNNATLYLAGGGTPGVADQGYADLGAGVNEVVGSLILGGVVQDAGTYGSSASSAQNKNDEYFSGSGMITVSRPILRITSSPPNVTISWTTNASGFNLQAMPLTGGGWTNDNTPVIPSGSDNTVTEEAAGTKFYRLAK